jgi:hypothetical protein
MVSAVTVWRTYALIFRARALLKRGRASDALPLCVKAQRLAPGDINVWLTTTWAFSDLKQHSAALDASEHALTICSMGHTSSITSYYTALAFKGQALNRLKRYSETVQIITHVRLNHRKANKVAWPYAYALHELGRYGELLTVADYWLTVTPQEPQY